MEGVGGWPAPDHPYPCNMFRERAIRRKFVQNNIAATFSNPVAHQRFRAGDPHFGLLGRFSHGPAGVCN